MHKCKNLAQALQEMQTVQHESKQIVIQLGQSQHDLKTCNLEAVITVQEMKFFCRLKEGRESGGGRARGAQNLHAVQNALQNGSRSEKMLLRGSAKRGKKKKAPQNK